jgi:hypothetical protein
MDSYRCSCDTHRFHATDAFQLEWVISVRLYEVIISAFLALLQSYTIIQYSTIVLAYPIEFQALECGVICICFLLITFIHFFFHGYVVSLAMKCLLS